MIKYDVNQSAAPNIFNNALEKKPRNRNVFKLLQQCIILNGYKLCRFILVY